VIRRKRPAVAVVGGGIAGLAAAWELVAGSDHQGRGGPIVHVFESDNRIGGKLRSAEFAGRTVDLAADAFLARRPEATELCDELGLSDELVPVGATGASIWARRRLRAMPDGLNLGVPTQWWPLALSGILSPIESLRVSRDVVLPRFGTTGLIGDRSVGEIVGDKLGRPVVDRLVDPLIGGIHAGWVDELSAAATFPLLIAAARQPGSFMHRMGHARSAPPSASGPVEAGPPFWSLSGSTADLVDRLAAALGDRGVGIHVGAPVEAIEDGRPGAAGRSRWILSIGGTGGAGHRAEGPVEGGSLEVDAVVLAVPAPEAAVLLAPHAPVAAGMLSTIEYASVAVVTMSLPAGTIRAPLTGTGFLVPRTSVIDGRAALITGCTYLGRKWPHLARPGDELLRASVGRFGDDRHRQLDDDELGASVFGELAAMVGIDGTRLETRVTRWDRSFPQYAVGHLIRVGAIEQDVAELGGVAVAGAAFSGVGIPACIGSGRAAARRVLASVTGEAGAPGAPGAPGGRPGATGPAR
jgi:protoporphyrinogen/coproporphyrinogen III oxidase